MRRLKFFLAALFIAPEIIISLAGVALLFYFPDHLTILGKNIRSDSEIWKFLPGFTIVFATTAFTYSSKIRAPLESSSNKSLYHWPLYQLLVDRVYVSLFYAIAAGAAGLWLWFFGQTISEPLVGAVFFASTGAAAATALTMLLAHQKLRELLEKYSP